MHRIWKAINLIVLGFLITVSLLGTFYKHIAFGNGAGDLFNYILLYLVTLTHLILTLLSIRKGPIRHLILTLVFSTLAVWISLEATLWRESAYPWNGSIFYLPCPTEIHIQNGNVKKKLRITMCSMTYYSEFTATWDGYFMKVETGALKIPAELDEYIRYPIARVHITPEFDNSTLYIPDRKLPFITDTLVVNKTYRLAGEIISVSDAIPVMQVRINR